MHNWQTKQTKARKRSSSVIQSPQTSPNDANNGAMTRLRVAHTHAAASFVVAWRLQFALTQ